MVRAMSSVERRNSTLRAIAERLWIDPAASFEELAKAAGISRRTLYRIAPSREALTAILHREALAVTGCALRAADLTGASWPDAITTLVFSFVNDVPLYAFWTQDSEANPDFDLHLIRYRRDMTRFFARGQSEAHIDPQLPPDWVLEIFDGLLFASANARRSGVIPPADLPGLVVSAFLGACRIRTDR